MLPTCLYCLVVVLMDTLASICLSPLEKGISSSDTFPKLTGEMKNSLKQMAVILKCSYAVCTILDSIKSSTRDLSFPQSKIAIRPRALNGRGSAPKPKLVGMSKWEWCTALLSMDSDLEVTKAQGTSSVTFLLYKNTTTGVWAKCTQFGSL